MSELKRYLRWSNLDFCVFFAIHNTEIEVHSLHSHEDFFELVLVRSGRGLHEIDGERIPIESGSVFLIPPGTPHRYINAFGMEIYNILFGRNFFRYFSEDLLSLPNYQLLFHLDFAKKSPAAQRTMRLDSPYFPEAVRILDDTVAEQKADEPGGRTAVLCNLLQIFLLVFRHAVPLPEQNDARSSYACRISRLLAVLDRRYEEDWTLEKMAAFTRMAPGSFRLEFRRLTGESPIRHLLRTRLCKARQMIEISDATIGEIAMRCGFRDSNYFTRQFHAEFGETPRQIRGRCREFKQAWGEMRYQQWLESCRSSTEPVAP